METVTVSKELVTKVIQHLATTQTWVQANPLIVELSQAVPVQKPDLKQDEVTAE